MTDALLLVGHGSRSDAGRKELLELGTLVAQRGCDLSHRGSHNNAGSLAPITVSAPALFAYGTRSAVRRSTTPVRICIGGDPFFRTRKNYRREIRKAAETLSFRRAGRELFLARLDLERFSAKAALVSGACCPLAQVSALPRLIWR